MIKENEPLCGKTSWKIGGPAKYFIEPESIEDLSLILKYLRDNKVPALILGGGSNLLVSDSGVQAAVLRLSSYFFCEAEFDGHTVEAGAGVSLKKLIKYSLARGLSGFESLAGIPGTLGGAVMMNAGRGRDEGSISDLIVYVRVMDMSGREDIKEAHNINFSYRNSGLDGYIITGVKMRLPEAVDKAAVRKRVIEYVKYRVLTQDFTFPSAGCVFKNPEHDSAGRMIDACGLKGKTSGGAAISQRHANFILNLSAATCTDVQSLMEIMVSCVKERFGVVLQPEIKLWQ